MVNNALTNFSLSPCHLLASDEAEMLKKVILASEATALAIMVFPFPGGPYNNNPLEGARNPVKS
jgi:hypothetical protein